MYKDDRRMFGRFEVDFSAEIKYPEVPEVMESDFAQCCDVSAGGVGLYSNEALIPGANLELSLAIPDGHSPFRALARVVWSKQVHENRWRSGLKFKKVDFMGTRRILETVAQNTDGFAVTA